MTTVAVVVDPPRPGLVLPRLPATTPLSPDLTAECYAAMLADVAAAVERSGADLLVNYRPAASLPDEHAGGDVEHEVRQIVDPVADEPRYEVQVGESFAGRVGNTVAHLLDEKGVSSVAVVEPTVPFLRRAHVDGTAMKLRRNDVVLAPGGDGRVAFAGFAAAPDFAGAFEPPTIATLADRAHEAELATGFAESLQVVETGRDLAGALAELRARRRAGSAIPERFADFVADHDLVAQVGEDGLDVVQSTDRD